ncbi:hypothetical protein [Pontibacter populi]|uniref:DNA topoisomerase IV n=1 Tax=Pontibacter populi TaxID=890055 RepID=A0ABV1RRA8_9BACT
MNIKLISLIMLSLYSFCFAKENNCKDFKKGTFELNSVDGSTHIITRTKNKQIERVGRTGSIFEFDIKWRDDCSYILYNRKMIKGVDEFSEYKIDTLYNKVIGVDGKNFKVLTTIKEFDFEVEAVMKKVK